MVGPAGLVQEVSPELPETLNVIVPLGGTAPVDPVTDAVKVRVAPRTGDPEALIDTAGIAGFTRVVVAEAVIKTGLYPLSPGKVNVAP